MKSIKLRIIAITLPLAIIAVTALYYFAWRPNDKNYQSAINTVNTMQGSTNYLTETFDTNAPIALFTDEDVEKFQQSISSYERSLSALAESPATTRSVASAPVFAQNKDKLHECIRVVKDTASSIDAYYEISRECGFIRIYTPEELTNDQQVACDGVFASISKLPGSNFKSQYLEPYAKNIQALVAAYLDTSPKKEERLKKLRDSMDPFFVNTSIEYNLPSAPTKELEDLKKALQQEKSAFIR